MAEGIRYGFVDARKGWIDNPIECDWCTKTYYVRRGTGKPSLKVLIRPTSTESGTKMASCHGITYNTWIPDSNSTTPPCSQHDRPIIIQHNDLQRTEECRVCRARRTIAYTNEQ